MTRLLRLGAALWIIPVVALAQKPQPTSALERGSDPIVAVADDGMSYAHTGRPAMMVGLDTYVAPGTDEQMARAALAQFTGSIGLRSTSAADLAVTETHHGLTGTVVRLQQTVNGVPVWGTETVVNFDNDQRLQLIANGYRPEVSVASTTPALSAAEARALAFAHLDGQGTTNVDRQELLVWPAASGARLAWAVRAGFSDAPLGDWEVIVDAQTGELLRVADRAVYHGARGGEEPPTALPTVESHPLYSVVDGSGFIFDPDPLTRAGVAYGTPGYVDGNDANTPQLEAARSAVTLRDITFTGTEYRLVGPWAEIREIEAPAKGLFPRPDGMWNFNRFDDGFEAANVYWQIDNFMRYVNVTLGVTARPSVYPGGVRFDAHGFSGQDNSRYSSGAQDLSFGEGCVDDSEDADVIIHELGHGLHDFLTTISQVDGLSEGLGDYVAVSYSRSLGLQTPASASYNWVFKWDGHNPCWPGRVTNIASAYPTGSVPHARGQHWSTSNMRIWDAIGGPLADKAVLEGIRLTTGSSTQPQAANAAMQAASNMGYTGAQLQAMFTSYQQQGYTGLVMPVAADGRPGRASAELTAPAPNPFNGLTSFEVVVDQDQQVTVEVLDMLGRHVATLFEGEIRAGGRYPFALEAAGLRAGVYVVRAVGETFSLTQRATLVR